VRSPLNAKISKQVLVLFTCLAIAYFYKRQLAKNAAAKISANIQKKESKIKGFGGFFSTSVNFVHPSLPN